MGSCSFNSDQSLRTSFLLMTCSFGYIWETNTLDVPLWFVLIKTDFNSSYVSQDLVFACRWRGPSLFLFELIWWALSIKLTVTSLVVFGKTFAITAASTFFSLLLLKVIFLNINVAAWSNGYNSIYLKNRYCIGCKYQIQDTAIIKFMQH